MSVCHTINAKRFHRPRAYASGQVDRLTDRQTAASHARFVKHTYICVHKKTCKPSYKEGEQ